MPQRELFFLEGVLEAEELASVTSATEKDEMAAGAATTVAAETVDAAG